MTADFTRWTKSPKQAWAVTAVAFPVCNLLMLMVGGIYTAVAGQLDFFFGLSVIALGIPIMIIQWASNGSTCDGCLYNAVQGFKNVSYYISKGKINFSWKKIALIVMFAGTVVAASNLLTSIVPWLLLLGTVVSLVGGVLIGHFWVVARKSNLNEILAASDRRVNVPAVIGFLAGVAIAVPIVTFVPDIPSVIGGLIGGIGVYPLVARMQGHFKSGRLTAKGIGGRIGQGTAAGTTNTDQPDMPDSPSGSAITTEAKDVNKNLDSIMDAKRDQVK
jgi:cytosine permease